MKDQDRAATRERLNWLAWLMDNSIIVPGTNFRVGLDSIIGLIPGVGDALGALISSYIMAEAARLGAPKTTLLRMGFNVAIESLIGIIPLFGDLFDMAWKSNQRNVKLLANYVDNPRRSSNNSRVFVVILTILLIILVFGLVLLGFFVVRALVQWLSA